MPYLTCEFQFQHQRLGHVRRSTHDVYLNVHLSAVHLCGSGGRSHLGGTSISMWNNTPPPHPPTTVPGVNTLDRNLTDIPRTDTRAAEAKVDTHTHTHTHTHVTSTVQCLYALLYTAQRGCPSALHHYSHSAGPAAYIRGDQAQLEQASGNCLRPLSGDARSVSLSYTLQLLLLFSLRFVLGKG